MADEPGYRAALAEWRRRSEFGLIGPPEEHVAALIAAADEARAVRHPVSVEDWVVVLPVIAPRSETAAARAMLDCDSGNILIVDNTPDGSYAGGPWLYHRDQEGRNLGVAASWNAGAELGRPFTVLMSSYLVLDEGITRTVERMVAASNEWGCLTWQACHLWGFWRHTFDVAGTFDTNYWPAYFEDVSYLRVLELAGIHNAANPMPKIAVPGICPQARSLHLGLAHPDMDKLRAYYHACWGGEPFQETFKHPFNDETKPITWKPPADDPRSIIGR